MPIKAELEVNKLRLRTHLGEGTVKIGKEEKPVEFSFSLNIDNRAIFVEFPNGIKFMYKMDDIIEDAISEYEAYLTTKAFVEEQEAKQNDS